MDQNTEAVAFERFTNLANLFFCLLMSGFVLSLIVFAMRARTKEIGGAPLLWRLFALGFLALWLYGAVTRGLGLFSVRRFVLHPDRMLVSFRKRIEEADYGNTTLCLTPNAHSLNYGSGERTLPLVEFSDSRLTSELRKRLPREEWCQVCALCAFWTRHGSSKRSWEFPPRPTAFFTRPNIRMMRIPGTDDTDDTFS
jgi:hypothetical protein